jgi:hypothetical protein
MKFEPNINLIHTIMEKMLSFLFMMVSYANVIFSPWLS